MSQQRLSRQALLPRPSIDESRAPNLVAQVLDQQYREGFCAFVQAKFAGQFYGYNTRVAVNRIDVARHHRVKSGQAFDWALRSLGCLQLGRTHGDQRQVIASREMYGRAIQRVVRALNNPSMAAADSTLAAAILLGTYELANRTEQKSWMLHSRGISTLLRLRGAKAHTQGLARTLLVSFRGFLVFEAFTLGEHCLLEGPEWRAIIPDAMAEEERRGKVSRLGELIEYAFHEIAQCPGFLARTRVLVASDEISMGEREDLVQRITCCQQRLRELQAQISVGLKIEQQPIDQEYLDFIGLITPSAANTIGRYSLEGISSAIALLRQLLVVLRSDHSRRFSSVASVTPSEQNFWTLINDRLGDMTIAEEIGRSQINRPRQEGHMDSWFDRVSMSMGMVEEMPPI